MESVVKITNHRDIIGGFYFKLHVNGVVLMSPYYQTPQEVGEAVALVKGSL